MQAEKLFDEITQFVDESHQLLKKGAILELQGLDARVQTLCEAVLQLSQDERLHYADKLQELFGSLSVLGEELLAQKNAVADQIRGAAEHKKATVAYRVVESIDKIDKKEEE